VAFSKLRLKGHNRKQGLILMLLTLMLVILMLVTLLIALVAIS
jgi:hypothetical protein